MPDETDTNKLAFGRLRELIESDSALSEEVKKALAEDCEGALPKPIKLRKLFLERDASPK